MLRSPSLSKNDGMFALSKRTLMKFGFSNRKSLKYISFAAILMIFSSTFDQVKVFQKSSMNYLFSRNLYGRLLKTFEASEDFHAWIDDLELGWNSEPAEWLIDLCPEVVDHFNRFPVFKQLQPEEVEFMPFLPTDHAAQSVCTMKIAKAVASSTNSKLYLHAGSHLGAVIHGQVIPWDDDVDAIMDFRKLDEFYAICKGEGVQVHPSGVTFRCYKYFNALKVWLHYEGIQNFIRNDKEIFDWYTPFLDLFSYKIEDGRLWEVGTTGKRIDENYALEEYFPTRPYYYGGVYFLGPQAGVVENRYNLEICKMGNYNHRLERNVGGLYEGSFGKLQTLDCDMLARKFPFKEKMKEIISTTDGSYAVDIFPWKASDMDTMVSPTPSLEERQFWFNMPDDKGQELTNLLKNLNKVEVDNTNSPNSQCKGPLKVVELNAERGRWWMEAVSLLKDADVIILNEMDIGMARSDNQHTTRLMAHYLKMNYAWGLEFVELTPGTKEDRWNSNQVPDFQGLHGNALLTKCNIADPVIFRNQIGGYFSTDPTFENAQGSEKRLGGRMGMLATITVDNRKTVIGSMHKVDGYFDEFKKYIGKRDAVIAGDQRGSYCGSIGLQNIVSAEGGAAMHNTWPASCTTVGNQRGDNICSNMKVIEEEATTKPCVSAFGFSTEIGDHALTSVVLAGNESHSHITVKV